MTIGNFGCEKYFAPTKLGSFLPMHSINIPSLRDLRIQSAIEVIVLFAQHSVS